LCSADSSYNFPGLQTPGRCDFDVDLCHWQNLTDDDFDWQRHTGDTPSIQTGPMYDHSKGYRGGGRCDAWYNEHANENKDELEGCLTAFYFITCPVSCLMPCLHCAGEIRKRRFHSENASNVFDSVHTAITGQFGFVFEENSERKSHDHCEIIVFEKLRFQNVFCPHENANPAFSNSSCLKSVSGKLFFVTD